MQKFFMLYSKTRMMRLTVTYWVEDEDKPDVKRYALLLGVLTTAVIVPTEFWAWIPLAISSIGVLVTIGFALLVVCIMYLMR